MNDGVPPGELANLLARISQGDDRALARLYDLTAPTLYTRLMAILHRPDWAQEALQDCYLRVWHRASAYSPEKGPAINWLVGIARYRAFDLLDEARKRQQRAESELDAARIGQDFAESMEAMAMRLEREERLSRCMMRLPPVQRRCILLAYHEGYSHQELATALNAPLGTVKAWLRRGVINLRQCLGRQEVDLDEIRKF